MPRKTKKSERRSSEIIAIQGRLRITPESQKVIDDLMRKYSAALKIFYNLFVENDGVVRYEIVKEVRNKLGLSTVYNNAAYMKARTLYSAMKKVSRSKKAMKKVIFGGKHLFTKMRKRYLDEHTRRRLKQQWIDLRKGSLASIGETGRGNKNLKFIVESTDPIKLKLRIQYANRKFIHVDFVSQHRRLKDLVEVIENKESYTVTLKRVDGKYYAHVVFSRPIPEPKYTLDNSDGVVGIFISIKPLRIYLAKVKKDGNLEEFKKIPAHYLGTGSINKKDYYRWQYAHEIINYALEHQCPIAIPQFKNLNVRKGKRYNRLFYNTGFVSLYNYVERLALRQGIQVIKVRGYISKKELDKYQNVVKKSRQIIGALIYGRRAIFDS